MMCLPDCAPHTQRASAFPPQRAPGGGSWTVGQPSPSASRAASCPERPCAAASLPSASRSSEAEDDALTRALSLVKRRKRTSLACEAVRGADAVGEAPPDAASVPGSCAASGPPACHAGPAIPPTMLHAYVMALTAQSRDVRTVWAGLPPSFLHGGVQAPAAPPLGGADAPGAAWERAPSDRAHPLPYWRQGVSPH